MFVVSLYFTLKPYDMTTFRKLELWAESTNNIEELRNAFIEVISNNNLDLEFLYLDHKKSVDRAVEKDLHI